MRSTGQEQQQVRSLWQKLHIDLPLLLGILSLMMLGLFIVFSAGGQSIDIVYRQAVRLGHRCHIESGQYLFLY
jgi:rod shape determining protein RodA